MNFLLRDRVRVLPAEGRGEGELGEIRSYLKDDLYEVDLYEGERIEVPASHLVWEPGDTRVFWTVALLASALERFPDTYEVRLKDKYLMLHDEKGREVVALLVQLG